MKTTKVLGLFLIGLALGVSSCKKEGCTNPSAVNYNEDAVTDDGSCDFKPAITLLGDNPASVNIGATYVDAGASAFVTNVGSVDVTTDLSQVNTSQAGSFVVTYTASNEHGTTTATRTVNVVYGQGVYVGTYSTNSTCDATGFPHVADPQIVASSNPNQVLLNDAFTLLGGTIVFQIDGPNVTVPSTTIPIELLGNPIGALEFSGSGTMNSTGTEMVINYTWERTGLLTDSGTCTITYTK